jgi:hypothetical protein
MRRADGSSLQRGLQRNCIYATSLVVLFAVGFICAQQASGQGLQPDNGQSTLHGTVINSVTHEPIARALVYSSGDRLAMLTDS